MSDNAYTIRPAAPADADTLAAMWLEMGRQHTAYDAERWHWAEESDAIWREHFLDIVGRQDTVCLVAEAGPGRVAGYVLAIIAETAPIWATRRRGQVYDLYVADGHRRRGVGRRLMLAALDELKARGSEEVLLRVSKENVAAVRLYERLGMRIVLHEMYKRL